MRLVSDPTNYSRRFVVGKNNTPLLIPLIGNSDCIYGHAGGCWNSGRHLIPVPIDLRSQNVDPILSRAL
ncbi:MAG: hypothetical protein WA705_13935 [Candidatus Ozemobacteraceae bacterium]